LLILLICFRTKTAFIHVYLKKFQKLPTWVTNYFKGQAS
jgi:hypothetical protein